MSDETLVTPTEAKRLLDTCRTLGIADDDLAEKLGVSVLYLGRLAKDSYWKEGHIPKKTGLALKRLVESYSPTNYPARIIRDTKRLNPGDVYIVHSARELVEITNEESRRGVIECAKKGVKVIYMFPDTPEIFSSFPGSGLSLNKFLQADLKTQFGFLRDAFLSEAKTLGEQFETAASENIEFRELKNPFMFSPWTKIIYLGFSKEGEEPLLYQEHFSVEHGLKIGGGSSYGWTCRGEEAKRIAGLLMAGDHTRL